MNRIAIFLISTSFAGGVFGAIGFDTKTTSEKPLLREGFILNGTEGRLVGPDSNDVWFFEVASDVNDYRAVVKAGTKLQLLPSAALEKMIADIRKDPDLTYRLWGARITKYKGRNFIFPDYFLPLKIAGKSEPALLQEASDRVEGGPEPQRTLEPELTDSNSVLSIPPDILKKLKARRQKIADTGRRTADSNTPSADRPGQTVEKTDLPNVGRYSRIADSVLVDRIGFLVARDGGRLVFASDALGRNVGSAFGTLRLLPCEILELAELKQAGQLEHVRFRIAGITTEYEGQCYLLLQKATPSYNYGNFGR